MVEPAVQSRTNRVPQAEFFDIQVLRAVAALGVVCDHAAIVTASVRPRPLLVESVAMFLGFFGVYVFFGISGFIMRNSAAATAGSAGSALKFLVKRIVRILPLYAIFTTLKCATSFGSFTATQILYSFLFIPYYNSSSEIRPILGQGWTLNYEIFFYIIFGTSLLLPRFWCMASTTVVLIGAVVCGRVLGDDGPTSAVWQVYTDPILLLFMGGMLLPRPQGTIDPRLAALARWLYPALFALAVAIFAAQTAGGYRGSIFGIVIALLAVATVGAATLTPAKRHSPTKDMLHVLGDASYSIYLSHTFVIQLVKKLALANSGPVAFVVLSLAGAIVFGLAVHVFVEKPVTARLGAWVRRVLP